MVSDDLLRRILRLYSHGQVITADWQNTIFIKRLAGYFTVAIQAQLRQARIFRIPYAKVSLHNLYIDFINEELASLINPILSII